LQDCEARISIKLAFDTQMRTSAATPEEARDASLAVYDTISDVFAALQGWSTQYFNTLDRTSQGDEPTRNGLFIYKLEFSTTFEDATAEA
jgi:predicted extracellular nuclease